MLSVYNRLFHCLILMCIYFAFLAISVGEQSLSCEIRELWVEIQFPACFPKRAILIIFSNQLYDGLFADRIFLLQQRFSFFFQWFVFKEDTCVYVFYID